MMNSPASGPSPSGGGGPRVARWRGVPSSANAPPSGFACHLPFGGRIAAAALLALAACGPSSEAPAPPVEGAAVREAINRETVAYADCVMGAINSIEIKDRLAPALADEAFANCRASRDVLLADVLKFRRIGHPSEPEANSMVTARHSPPNPAAILPENVLAATTPPKPATKKVKNNL